MKAFIARYEVVISALLCLLVIAGAWLGMRLSADAGTYALKDIAGDASQLDDLVIQMTLSDGAHTQHITVDEGELNHTFEYLPPIKSYYPEKTRSFSQYYTEHEDADVVMEMDTRLEDVYEKYESWVTHMRRAADFVRVSAEISRNTIESIYSDRVQVMTDVTVYDESHPFVFKYESYKDVYKQNLSAQGEARPIEPGVSPYEYMGMDYKKTQYTNEEYYVSADLSTQDENGTVYFTPALSPLYGGTSAIYRVDEWGSYVNMIEPSLMDGKYEYYNDTQVPYGSVTPVVTFPVDGHAMRTLRLDVVDGRLCLLLVADGMLRLRVYDMDGALLNEVQIAKMSPQRELVGNIYIIDSKGSKMLCYHLSDIYVYDEETGEAIQSDEEDMLFCIELGEQTRLRSVLAVQPLLKGCAFVDSRWVLLETGRSEDEIQAEHFYYPNHDYLSILDEEGAVLYRGEVVTDTKDDITPSYQLTEFQDNNYYGNVWSRQLWVAEEFVKEKQS